MSGPDAPLARLDAVALVWGGARPIDCVSLAIDAGERVAIVGDAGAGKSLLARLVLGLVPPSEGRVALFGENLAAVGDVGARRLRARCGVALQGGSLFGELTVEDNLRLGFAPTRGDPPRHRRRIDRLLIDFGLEQCAGVAAAALSAGDQRRLELARAFLREPALLVLDEPFQGAFGRAAALEAQLARQVAGRRPALLLLTQDETLAARMASRVLTLRRGRLHDAAAPVA